MGPLVLRHGGTGAARADPGCSSRAVPEALQLLRKQFYFWWKPRQAAQKRSQPTGSPATDRSLPIFRIKQMFPSLLFIWGRKIWIQKVRALLSSKIILSKLHFILPDGIFAAHVFLFRNQMWKPAMQQTTDAYSEWRCWTVHVIVPHSALECVALWNKWKPLLLVSFIG